MPELILAFVDGTVERQALDDALLANWTVDDVSRLLTAVCARVQEPPGRCRVEVRWLPGHRIEAEVWGNLGAARLDPFPVACIQPSRGA